MKYNFDNDLVSVIIPIFNSEKFISKTLDSVINQTYKNYEIIIVDDCSLDKSYEMIKKYLVEYSNIIYLKLEKNSGAAIARNKALELAHGRYVAFLDSDDLWYKKKLEKQLMLLKSKKCVISYTAIEIIDENDKLLKNKRNVINEINYNFLLKNTMIATSTVVIDRNISGDFAMPLIRSGQDYATWLMLLRNGDIACGINEVLVKYRKCKGSLSSRKYKNIKKVWKIQVYNEHIQPAKASINSVFYVINALKKYFF